MAQLTPDHLYDLMPAVYRLRDIDQGYPLKALLRLITQQVDVVKQDIDRLWDDFAIETCRPWVVPYIGDLVGNNLLHDAGARTRVDVARTIYYRRRKGTLPMLEQLARDVTGWGCHAVEFFEILGWTQNLNHLRLFNLRSPDLRDVDAVDRINGPFDQTAHTVDVRPPSTVEGWHNIRNIGFFIYRLTSYPLRGTAARQAEPPNAHGWHFSTLGAPVRLFNRWRREGDEAGLATEPFVPGPIRPVAFHRDIEDYRAAIAEGRPPDSDYIGGGLSLAIIEDGNEVAPQHVICKDLSAWDRPPTGMVAVDVTRGRMAFAVGEEPQEVEVEYHYGFSDDLGGGPYDRRRRPGDAGLGPDTLADPTAFGTLVQVPSPGIDSISQALTQWVNAGSPPAVIQIDDDRTYEEDLAIPLAGDRLTIQAANYRRPTVLGSIDVTELNPEGRLGLDGLLIAGAVHLHGNLKELRISHCTLVPGLRLKEDGAPEEPTQASITADATNVSMTLRLERSITGGIRLPKESVGLLVSDVIIDGVEVAAVAHTNTDDQFGPPATLRRATIFGAVHVEEMTLASDVVFTAPTRAERTQNGCVRFSLVATGSRLPRRYRCQPELALADRARELGLESVGDLPATEASIITNRMRASFSSIHFGDSGYGQLSLNAAPEIRRGGEDGSEMGAFCRLRQPQRETNLRIRLDEYLPFGLKPALIYVT